MNATAADLGLRRWQLGSILVLGLGDLATGVLLVIGPGLVERLLSIPSGEASNAVWLRWIGVFVASIGLAYLWPLRGEGARRRLRLRFALEWTAGARLAVAASVAVSVISGDLDQQWCLVGAYDALAAIAQLALLGAWRPDDAR